MGFDLALRPFREGACAALVGVVTLLIAAPAAAQFPIPPINIPTLPGQGPIVPGGPGYIPPQIQPYGPQYPQPGYPQPQAPRRTETPFALFGGGTVGFRAARLDADIEGADDTYGFMGSASALAVFTVKFLSGRADIDAHVGGGDQGVEPRVAGNLTFGVIGHFARSNGLFIRAGVGGNWEGNDRYTFSHFDLPLGEGGWQLTTPHVSLEVGVRGGATLTGRVGMAPSATRELDVTGRWGGFFTIALAKNSGAFPGAWLDIEYARFEGENPIQVGEGRLCGGYGAFLCIDGRMTHADLPFSVADDSLGVHDGALSLYTGLTLGWGAALSLDGPAAFMAL